MQVPLVGEYAVMKGLGFMLMKLFDIRRSYWICLRRNLRMTSGWCGDAHKGRTMESKWDYEAYRRRKRNFLFYYSPTKLNGDFLQWKFLCFLFLLYKFSLLLFSNFLFSEYVKKKRWGELGSNTRWMWRTEFFLEHFHPLPSLIYLLSLKLIGFSLWQGNEALAHLLILLLLLISPDRKEREETVAEIYWILM